MRRRRSFFSSSSLSILVIILTINDFANQLKFGGFFVGADLLEENRITLTDFDDQEGRLFLGGANASSLAALLLAGLVAGLALAGLAGLAYLLWQRGDGGDNHYYYSSGGGGYDHIDHADHGDYDYDDYYRGRTRRSSKFDEQVACKLGTRNTHLFLLDKFWLA